MTSKSLLLCLMAGGMAFGQLPDPTYVNFDPAGSTGTFPAGINEAGAITGFYLDALGTHHGFVRAPDGTITAFDPIGSAFTIPEAIEEDGAITGFFTDTSGVTHGFVRSPDGTVTAFDAPVAKVTTGTDTTPFAISRGMAVGFYIDGSQVQHGFLRSASGEFKTFEVPAGSAVTNPTGINAAGEIAGSYARPGRKRFQGFIRDPGGSVTLFDAPNRESLVPGPIFINLAGQVGGSFGDIISTHGFLGTHGFLRDPDGSITTFDALPGRDTTPRAISPTGAIVGSAFSEISGSEIGFLRGPDGRTTTFQDPFASDHPGGTSPVGINATGVIVGWFNDAQGIVHGFVRTP